MDTIGQHRNGDAGDRDTMMLFGGLACMLFGAGLVLSSTAVKGYLGNVSVGNLVTGVVPDVERYLKLRAM
jgi:hypothetical protein